MSKHHQSLNAKLSLCLTALLLVPSATHAQATPAGTNKDPNVAADTASSNGSGPAGIVPIVKGFNASIGTSSQHDSAAGWSSLVTPNIAWRFDHHFSVNLGTPIFDYVVTSKSVAVKVGGIATGATTTVYKTQHHALGDTTLDAEFEAHPALLDYNLSVVGAAPTGDNADGLGAGQFTYGITNHFEREIFGFLTPDIEIGIGDNPNLANSRVHKSYQIVGTNAQFQAGLSLYSLPFHASFSSEAYENLPIAGTTVISDTVKGKKGKSLTTTTKVSGEDNGFLNTLDIPLNGHVTVSGFYNRSLINHDDTAGFSLTFTLRATPHPTAK